MLTYTFTAIKKSVYQILVVPWPVDEFKELGKTGAFKRSKRLSSGFIYSPSCPRRKYNDKMIDILYLNSHWMENDRFTAIKMYMHVGLFR